MSLFHVYVCLPECALLLLSTQLYSISALVRAIIFSISAFTAGSISTMLCATSCNTYRKNSLFQLSHHMPATAWSWSALYHILGLPHSMATLHPQWDYILFIAHSWTTLHLAQGLHSFHCTLLDLCCTQTGTIVSTAHYTRTGTITFTNCTSIDYVTPVLSYTACG